MTSSNRELLFRDVAELAPLVDKQITSERILRYLTALANAPAPSTTSSFIRAPILHRLLEEDGFLGRGNVEFHGDYRSTGNTVVLTGSKAQPELWYLAHLDTLSYLVQPKRDHAYPLVPFGYHLAEDGAREAEVLRFVLERERYETVVHGLIVTAGGHPSFVPHDEMAPALIPGDRVVYTSPLRYDPQTQNLTGHLDNAGAAAALAVAANVLAEANVSAVLGFPDEEEGPKGSGNFIIGRGGIRLLEHFPTPALIVVADVQQAGGNSSLSDTRGGLENSTRMGGGAVLAEFSSLGRGAVTPPHLYALATQLGKRLRSHGVYIQESNNAYTSRSDDVSAMLKTPNVLLLGFAGFNRHFDRGLPQANLMDLVHLSKALVYQALLTRALKRLVHNHAYA
jgi:putative aminopeptidase FrvX